MARSSRVKQQIVAWTKRRASTSKIICAMHMSSTLTGDDSKPDQIMSGKRANIIDLFNVYRRSYSLWWSFVIVGPISLSRHDPCCLSYHYFPRYYGSMESSMEETHTSTWTSRKHFPGSEELPWKLEVHPWNYIIDYDTFQLLPWKLPLIFFMEENVVPEGWIYFRGRFVGFFRIRLHVGYSNNLSTTPARARYLDPVLSPCPHLQGSEYN